MRNVWAITKKEIRSYFGSPIAYVVITGFVLLYGFFFYSGVWWFNAEAMQMAQNPYYAQQVNINQRLYFPLFHNMNLLWIFVIPLLTMRLFAEERKTGTEELLFTSPVSVGQIIAGKYLASLVVLAVTLGLTAVLSVFTFATGNPEFAPWLMGYLGLFLTGAAFLAIGLFYSSLTENQIVAGALAFVTVLMFLVISWVTSMGSGLLQTVLGYVSFAEHFDNMARGILDTKDLVYFLSLSFLGLFLTHSVIQSRRWR